MNVLVKLFLILVNLQDKSQYQEGLSIDRISSEENYCPENCQWITVAENTAKSNCVKA